MAIVAYYHITAAGAGLKDGSTWANAMGIGEFQTHLNGAVLAGHVHFVQDGAYTMTANIDCSARDGSITSPIAIIGVKAGTTNEGAAVVYSDWSRDAADRPVITAAAYNFAIGSDYKLINIEFATTYSTGVTCDSRDVVENCKVTNSSGTANRYAVVQNTGGGSTINCELISTNGYALSCGSNTVTLFNYLHDSNIGLRVAASVQSIIGNVFDTNATEGINAAIKTNINVINNVFYAGAKGLAETTGYGWLVINNIFEGQTTSGISWATTQTDTNTFMDNHGDDARCTDMWANVDVTTVFQDYWVTTGDPLFSNPAGGLFDLGAGSPCLDVGLPNSLIAAASTINKGAWMTPVVSTAAPTFAGITKFEILSNNKFYVEWATGVGVITSYNIYLRNGNAAVFSATYLAKKVDDTITAAIVCTEGTQLALPTAGATYHCGVRAENAGTEDANAVTLSNICAGSEAIQRMTNTILDV